MLFVYALKFEKRWGHHLTISDFDPYYDTRREWAMSTCLIILRRNFIRDLDLGFELGFDLDDVVAIIHPLSWI